MIHSSSTSWDKRQGLCNKQHPPEQPHFRPQRRPSVLSNQQQQRVVVVQPAADTAPAVSLSSQKHIRNATNTISSNATATNTVNKNNMTVFSKTHDTTMIALSSSSSPLSPSNNARGDKNATLSKSYSNGSSSSNVTRSKAITKTTNRSDTSTVLSSSFSSSEPSDERMATTTTTANHRSKVGSRNISDDAETTTTTTTITTSPEVDDVEPKLKHSSEGTSTAATITTPQKWHGGRGYHYTTPQNDRHNNLEAAVPTREGGEGRHFYNYGGKTLVKSKFGTYNNNNNKDEEDMKLVHREKDVNNGTIISGTGQMLQIPKNATGSTTATNTEVPSQDDDKEADVSSASNDEEEDDSYDLHVLHHYSCSSGSSSFHFDIDVVKNNNHFSKEGQQQRCDDVDAPATAADKNAFVTMTPPGEHFSCFLSTSSSSTLTSLPPTPLHHHHHRPAESRNPPNEEREMGNNKDRIRSFLLQQQQRQRPPAGRSKFSPPPPVSPSDFEPYNGNQCSQDEADFVNVPGPTKVDRQKVSSTDPFWTSQEHPSDAELSQVYNKRSVDAGDDQPTRSRSVFDSAWSSDGIRWSASDDGSSSWVDFTADPFQSQAKARIKKPSPTKPQGGAPATPLHGDYFNTVASVSTKSVSSFPEAYASSTHYANPLLHGLPSRYDTNPTRASAFARFNQPTVPHSSSNLDEQLSYAKQEETEPSFLQPDDEETEFGPLVDQPRVHFSLARPTCNSGAGPTLAHPVPTQPTSVNDNRQSDPVSDKFDKQQEQARRGPLLLGPLLEARYQSLRNAGSYDKAMGNHQPAMNRYGPRWVTPSIKKTPTVDDVTSSSLLRESLLSKTTYDTELVSTSRDLEGSQEDPLETLSQLPDRYRKMIQLGLPADVIHNAMRRDGLAPALCLPSSTDTGDSKPCNFPRPEHEKTDPGRRFRVSWDTHSNVQNTLWAMVGRDELWMKETIQIDEDEFISLFQQQPDPRGPCRLDSMTTSARIVDPQRANHADSILARFALSYREIARAMNNYDVDAFSLDQLRNLLSYMPTPHEAFKLRDHIAKAGGRHLLKSECEKFMAEMLSVDKAKEKLHAMLFMKLFPLVIENMKSSKSDQASIGMFSLDPFSSLPSYFANTLFALADYSDSRLVQNASDEIMSSNRLRRVLGVLLHLGNKINKAGGPPGMTDKASASAAAAIRLQSLINLGKPKALDRKTSFLQYAATILLKSNPDLIQFSDDLPNLQRAAEKVNWDELQEQVECLEVGLSNIRDLVADHTSTPILSADIEVGILQSTAIGRFASDACTQMAVVYHEVEASKQSLEALSMYFGEQKSEAGPQTVFHTLAMFTKTFESAVKQSVAREKERAIRDCRAAMAFISSSSSKNHHEKAARPQRAISIGPLEQIRDVLGTFRCKTMLSMEE
jgi:Formin Homology 2 Domain